MARNENAISACPARSAYTLVEILVVIGIMGILLFLGLPAFEKLAKGSGVEMAARNLTGKLGIARSYAITNRETVALVMPSYNASWPATFPKTYYFGAYRLCYVTPDTASPFAYNFKRWIPNEKWEFMPVGVAIFEANTNLDAANPLTSTSEGTASSTADPNFAVVNDVVCTDLGVPSATPLDNMRAVVFKSTGKLAPSKSDLASPGYDVFVTVGEGTYTGTGAVPTVTKRENSINIKIDKFTGRMSYGND